MTLTDIVSIVIVLQELSRGVRAVELDGDRTELSLTMTLYTCGEKRTRVLKDTPEGCQLPTLSMRTTSPATNGGSDKTSADLLFRIQNGMRTIADVE